MTDRNTCSRIRCAICDLPPLLNVHFGDGWEVLHWPGRVEWRELSFAEALEHPPLVGIRIMTCGSEICVFRAEHHGVPGAVYARVGDLRALRESAASVTRASVAT